KPVGAVSRKVRSYKKSGLKTLNSNGFKPQKFLLINPYSNQLSTCLFQCHNDTRFLYINVYFCLAGTKQPAKYTCEIENRQYQKNHQDNDECTQRAATAAITFAIRMINVFFNNSVCHNLSPSKEIPTLGKKQIECHEKLSRFV